MPAVSSSAMMHVLGVFAFQNICREDLRQHRSNDCRRIGLRDDVAHRQRVAPVRRAFEQLHDIVENGVEIAHLLGGSRVLDIGIFVGRARRSCRERQGRPFPDEACRAFRRIFRSDAPADLWCRGMAKEIRWPYRYDILPISALCRGPCRRPSNGLHSPWRDRWRGRVFLPCPHVSFRSSDMSLGLPVRAGWALREYGYAHYCGSNRLGNYSELRS